MPHPLHDEAPYIEFACPVGALLTLISEEAEEAAATARELAQADADPLSLIVWSA
jgi:hypothetical protein